MKERWKIKNHVELHYSSLLFLFDIRKELNSFAAHLTIEYKKSLFIITIVYVFRFYVFALPISMLMSILHVMSALFYKGMQYIILRMLFNL